MSDTVDLTLALWRSTPFQWGQADCLLSVGDYIAGQGGQDVAARFRGTYDTEAEALRLMGQNGGAVGLIDATCIPRVVEPIRGAVVVLDTGVMHVAALCTGAGIAARLERGVIEIDRRFVGIVQAWIPPYVSR